MDLQEEGCGGGAWIGLIWHRIGTGGIVYQIHTSDQGLLRLFTSPSAVAVCFTGIKIALVKCLSVFNWSCIHYGFYMSPQIKAKGLRSGEHGGHVAIHLS